MEFSFHTTFNSTQQQHVQKHYSCISRPQKFYLEIVSQKLDLYTSIYGISNKINCFTSSKNHLQQTLLFLWKQKEQFSLMRLGKGLQVSMEKDLSKILLNKSFLTGVHELPGGSRDVSEKQL